MRSFLYLPSLENLMNSRLLNISIAFLLLRMHLAVELPANCPICTCPNSVENVETPVGIYSKQSNENLASIQQPSPVIHMGPNEISNSAELFSREILHVNFPISFDNFRGDNFYNSSIIFAFLFRFWLHIHRLQRKISLCHRFQFGH